MFANRPQHGLEEHSSMACHKDGVEQKPGKSPLKSTVPCYNVNFALISKTMLVSRIASNAFVSKPLASLSTILTRGEMWR